MMRRESRCDLTENFREIIVGNHRKRKLLFFREIAGGLTESCDHHLFLITIWNLLIIDYAMICDLTENLREIILEITGNGC